MSLKDHATAARIIGETISNRADQMGDTTGVLTCLSEALMEAADIMEDTVREEAEAHAKATACTIDHAIMRTPACPACGAKRR